MLILRYASKKQLKEKVGTDSALRYDETSFFGAEYPSNGTGVVTGSNRPSITRIKNPKTGKLAGEFYASVTLKNHKIVKVS